MYIRSLHTACEEVIHRHRLPNTDYYLYMYIPTGKHMNYQYMYMYAYTSKADCTDSYAENLILKTIFLRKPHGCKQTSEKGEGRTPYPIALSHTHTHTTHLTLHSLPHYTTRHHSRKASNNNSTYVHCILATSTNRTKYGSQISVPFNRASV